ncbi:LacI family DNA-binding transcriptional regulator [Actinocatenispora sera]|uniref:LacI family transcriptional regulator n=1 Tax=Actinocatenispora sera TaxID=390989 RepID=A0A810L3Q2_9ACTN|nr:LacI family DNA-binding transcriptional regulator [Actinocatenispora sera]BCJ30094.1 LacI family transcriptional regulator [Actinocatenispora sera]
MTLSARPTLSQVADLAGVSVASVSRVLNGLPASPEMTTRVRAAVDSLGYTPDARARSLKVGRTEQLVLVVPDVGNPVYTGLMRAVAAVVKDAGYRLLLSTGNSEVAEEIAILDGLSSGYADGVIISPLRMTEPILDALQRLRHPAVVIGTPPAAVPVDAVQADSAAGVELAMQHLVNTGRHRIAFVNGPVDTVPGVARQRGFDRADTRLLAGAGRRHAAAAFTVDAGREIAGRVLDDRPDAVLCANDLLAFGVMRVAHSRGIRVPDDLAVVGIDDTDLAAVVSPGLTSVNLGSGERGAAAARLLLARIADPERPAERVVVDPWLTVRESSTPARQEGVR